MLVTLRSILCALLLLFAVPSAMAQISEPGTTETPRAAALHQYQRDLISVLALRSDASHLLGAALLARPLQGLAPGADYESLLKRAAKAADAGPVVTWAALAQCASAEHCPNPQALEQLIQQAPENAAVWLLQLDIAAGAGDVETQRAALRRAAAASHYDDYAGAVLGALAAAATALPVPPDALAAYAGDTEAGAASAQLFLSFGQIGTHPRPNFLPLVDLCSSVVADEDLGKLRKSCRNLARTLAWGSSVPARAAGLHLQQLLAPNEDARVHAQQRLDDLAWQVQNFSRLNLKALTNQTLAHTLLQLAGHGGTEMSMMYALLRERGIALEAPAAASAAEAPSIPAVPAAAATTAGIPTPR